MKRHLCVALLLTTLLASLAPTAVGAEARLEFAADSNWKFMLGDPSGAEAPSFSDKAWRSVDLPHDWSIEARPQKDNASGAGEGFFPAGIGWYRKTFHADAGWRDKRVSIEF